MVSGGAQVNSSNTEYINNICKGTNYQASAEGVGLGETGTEKKEFGDFKPFNANEIYKFIGLMFANGLTPRSNFDSCFISTPNRPIYDANFAKGVFDRMVHGVTISGLCCWLIWRPPQGVKRKWRDDESRAKIQSRREIRQLLTLDGIPLAAISAAQRLIASPGLTIYTPIRVKLTLLAAGRCRGLWFQSSFVIWSPP